MSPVRRRGRRQRSQDRTAPPGPGLERHALELGARLLERLPRVLLAADDGYRLRDLDVDDRPLAPDRDGLGLPFETAVDRVLRQAAQGPQGIPQRRKRLGIDPGPDVGVRAAVARPREGNLHDLPAGPVQGRLGPRKRVLDVPGVEAEVRLRDSTTSTGRARSFSERRRTIVERPATLSEERP